MTFENMLRTYRKQLGLSQEKMAEKINVSRQAITKWESGKGMPDIMNLKSIADLFQVSVDELLSTENTINHQKDFIYESCIAYDIDSKKQFDIRLGSANKIFLKVIDSGKLKIRLASNTIKSLAEVLKIKIDESQHDITITLKQMSLMTDDILNKELVIFIDLPKKYLIDTNLLTNCHKVELSNLYCNKTNLEGTISEIIINNGQGILKINNYSSILITLIAFKGKIDINQSSTTSIIHVPKNYLFKAINNGFATKLSFEENGEKTTDFSSHNSDNHIKLTGMKSELIITRSV